MEFWGVEVKAGEPLRIEPEDGMVIHLSQAVLGEPKIKGNEPVVLHVKVDDKKLVLGMLSSDKFPQLSFDLVFEKEFELSHNWKNGSIHFAGYQTALGDQPEDFGDFDESDSEEEEDVVPENPVVNGKGGQKGEQPKPATVAKTAVAAKPGPSEKPKAKVEQPAEDDDDSDDDNDSDDSSDGEDSDDDSDEDMIGGDNDDDSDDESDEETPKKVEVSKKRANDSAAKTPVPAKKAKANSPKSDGKKVGGHTATPHPAKKVGKTPVTPATDKSKAQTPKSGGISCKSCSKTFGSDKALESHTKAKHA